MRNSRFLFEYYDHPLRIYFPIMFHSPSKHFHTNR